MAASADGVPVGSGVAISMLLLLYLLGPLLPMTDAQPGFISIDCGSTYNYTDSSTGLTWTTDDGYINTGSNKKVSALRASDNHQQLSTARYFEQSRNKNCYILPVTINNSYLIRAFFLYGDLETTPLSNYHFNLSIDSTIVDGVSITVSDINDAQYHEFIVASTSNQVAFCIIPVVGNAFISSLELRALLPTMYQGVMFDSKYIKTLKRINNCVHDSDATVRFPDDVYDRLWLSWGGDARSLSTTANVPVGDNILDKIPMKVMQTAWTSRTIWAYMPFLEEMATTFYIAVYFAEIGTPNVTDLRSIDGSINGSPAFEGYNVSKNTGLKSTSEWLIDIDIRYVNISLAANPASTLKPLLNAIEFHAVYDYHTTATEAADSLNDLRQNLGLLDWTGDPCLPVTWDWLNCSSTKPPTVTQLKLSGYQLRGTIPPSIADLTYLTDVWLDNNFITGSIPNLVPLRQLRTLHLQNNSLTGSIPTSLADISDLSELYLQGNNLSGPVPAGLLSKVNNGLNLQVDSALNSSESESQGDSPKKKSGISGAVIGAAIGGVVVVILLIALVIFFWCQRKNKAKRQPHSEITGHKAGAYKGGAYPDASNKSAIPGGGGSHHVQMTRAFSQTEIQDATDNFRQKIGEGGFGPVFYGKFATGEEVAVKLNSATSGQGSHEFTTEVSLLSRVHHRNLVSLVGFCDDGDKQILVYEYMQNGTLRENLYGTGLKKVVDWQTRLDIALDAARGLEYLHNDCSPKIIHRDVKSNNILLNEKLLAKVADFGISKLAPEDDTMTGVSTLVRGTAGYLDPEYFATTKITQASDVYAFGVVLLEIISGRAPNDNKLGAVQSNLIQYARAMLRDGNLEQIVDPSLAGRYNIEAVWKLAELAMCCVEPLGVNRPDMRQVVRELTEAKNLEHTEELAPTTSASPGLGGSTALLRGYNAQSSYPSHPSTQPSQLDTDPDTHNYNPYNQRVSPVSFVRAPTSGSTPWSNPQPR